MNPPRSAPVLEKMRTWGPPPGPAPVTTSSPGDTGFTLPDATYTPPGKFGAYAYHPRTFVPSVRNTSTAGPPPGPAAVTTSRGPFVSRRPVATRTPPPNPC